MEVGSKIELTFEESTNQGQIIQIIGMHIHALNLDYPKEALRQMREHHSFKESAAVLDPNPFTHTDRQNVNGLKLKQLSLLLQLRENQDEIEDAKQKLREVDGNVESIRRMFGV